MSEDQDSVGAFIGAVVVVLVVGLSVVGVIRWGDSNSNWARMAAWGTWAQVLVIAIGFIFAVRQLHQNERFELEGRRRAHLHDASLVIRDIGGSSDFNGE